MLLFISAVGKSPMVDSRNMSGGSVQTQYCKIVSLKEYDEYLSLVILSNTRVL